MKKYRQEVNVVKKVLLLLVILVAAQQSAWAVDFNGKHNSATIYGAYIPKVFDDSGEQGMMLTVQLESQTRSWFSSSVELGYEKMKYNSGGLGLGLKPFLGLKISASPKAFLVTRCSACIGALMIGIGVGFAI